MENCFSPVVSATSLALTRAHTDTLTLPTCCKTESLKGQHLFFVSNWWSKRSVHQTAKLKCWFFEGFDDQNANTSTNCLLDGWQVSTDRGGQVVWLKAMHQKPW